VHFAVEGLRVLVQVGETVYRWVIDTIEQVGKVLSFIFKKILVLGEKLIRWLSFIFSWTDIKETSESILHIFTDALEEGPVLIDSLKHKSAEFFESLKSEVSHSRPSDEEIGKLNVRADDATGANNASKNPAANSARINWAMSQVEPLSSQFLRKYEYTNDPTESSSIMEGGAMLQHSCPKCSSHQPLSPPRRTPCCWT
jgi:hypothetical protein